MVRPLAIWRGAAIVCLALRCGPPEARPLTTEERAAGAWVFVEGFDIEQHLKRQLGDFDLTACWPPDSLEAITPVGVDAVVLRHRPAAGAAVQVLSTWRVPCAHARDAAGCRATLAALPMDPPLRGVTGGPRDGEGVDVAYTSGDTVGRAATHAELLALLGPIDTVCEAALLEYLHVRDFLGRGPRVRAARKEARGFALLGTEGDGCHEHRVFYTTVVTPDGKTDPGRPGVLADTADADCRAP